MRTRSLPLVSYLILLATGCAPQQPVDGATSVGDPITNGTADGSDPAVVALVDSNGTTLCTGTLISPQVVLTAAHCLEGETTGIDDRVFFGSSPTANGTFIPVAGVLVHPQYDPATLTDDLALLALASPSSVTPIPLLASTPDASLTNAQVRIVGFGDTAADASDYGQKRTGTSTVASVTATTLELVAAPSELCFGDSGGPALLTIGGVEYLAGVTSHGDTACDADDYDTRVDAFGADFIEPFLSACANEGCPYSCVPVGSTCPSGLECDSVEGGIDYSCQPVPTAAAPSSSSSCSSSPARRGPFGAGLALAAGIGLVMASRRARATSARDRSRRRLS